MKNRIVAILEKALASCRLQGLLTAAEAPVIEVELTKDPAHGDYATNLAMILASREKKNPRLLAGMLSEAIADTEGILAGVEIAGPGFMNFSIRTEAWVKELTAVHAQRERYGMMEFGRGKTVQVEFVSANPTGPLHIGHARGAVVGDITANLLAAAGYAVSREYYINDAGNQMHNLGRSLWYRYREQMGHSVEFPEGCYRGDYMKELASQMVAADGDAWLAKTEEAVIPAFTEYAAGAILEGIKQDLQSFGVTFDCYFSERDLYRDNSVGRLLAELQEKGFVYREGEALWFKTTAFGDDKDRVVVRQNAEPTYFAADIAYHANKYQRGFDQVIDIWGADHHGYISRLYAGIQALGRSPDDLKIILVQLVSLLRDGKPVAMSTRSGEFVTLREVIDEVGRDAARYNFMMRRSDSHLDFDLELAKKQSNENPVFYVQYAHARICSIQRMAQERGYRTPADAEAAMRCLKLPEEIDLIKAVTRFPELMEGAVKALEPHRLTYYLNELAALLHSYYNKNKVLSEDQAMSEARLYLVESVRIVLTNALKLLGVSTPERM
ncbi:MAG: arginine--tRNA ligase [Syntrophus sp. (in: bacteria)]|nr:arginine--tRNA ligase [Syntrophus sp. (in: bacteria)]